MAATSAPTAAELKNLQLRSQAERARRERAGVWSAGVVAHTEYALKPIAWIVEKLGVPENTIRWSLQPEYHACQCLGCVEAGNAGRPHIWDGDVDPLVRGLEALAAGKSIAISSGTGTGKSHTFGACGAMWFLATHERSIVLSIAPQAKQLLVNLWKEIGRFFPRFKQHFPSATLLTGNLRVLDGEGEQEVWAATAFAGGVGAGEDVAQRLAGFHHPSMLWLVEDAPGVDPARMNTIVNTATGRFNPILAMGNPDHRFDTLGTFAARSWVTAIRISALDHPNVVTGRDIVPGAVTAESVARRLSDADGDRNDPIYLSRVRGVAPSQSKRALIRLAWCEQAAARQDDAELRKGPLALGVDPADSPIGDHTGISRWLGACCTEVEALHATDASEVGRLIFREMSNPDAPVLARHVGIDSVGVGASTINELRRLGARVRALSGGMRAVPAMDIEARAEGASAGHAVPDAGRYANLRSQIFWRLREDLRLGRIAIPNDKKLFEELSAIEYKDEESGEKVTVAPKSEIKERIGRSPDLADALAYGNWVRARVPDRREVKKDTERPRNRDLGLEKFLGRHLQREAAERRQRDRVQRRRKT